MWRLICTLALWSFSVIKMLHLVFALLQSKFPTLAKIHESCKALPEFQASLPERQPDYPDPARSTIAWSIYPCNKRPSLMVPYVFVYVLDQKYTRGITQGWLRCTCSSCNMLIWFIHCIVLKWAGERNHSEARGLGALMRDKTII